MPKGRGFTAHLVSDSYQNEALAFAALREELRKEWDRL